MDTLSPWEAAARIFEPNRPRDVPWKTPGELALALDPRTVQTPALDVIDKALVDIAEGRCKRLMISMSPQEGKSERTSRRFPTWMLARYPWLRIAVVSYAHGVARRWGRRIRDDIAEHGQKLGIAVDPNSSAAHEWKILGHDGSVYCVGITGQLTGKPVDLLIVDDPYKNGEQADSEAWQETVEDWWTEVAIPRLGPDVACVIIQTRWRCLLPGSDILTPMGVTSIESISSGSTVLTSQGPQRVIAAASRRHAGDVISISTYGYPKPLTVTPDHRVLTTEGWREAGNLRALDWLVFPIPSNQTAPAALRAMLPPPPVSTASGTSRLTGARLPVTKEQLESDLNTGMTYQKIAEKYGRKHRATAFDWALHYGLTRPVDNALTGDPTSDPDFWRVVGYWLAEGDITAGRVGGKRNVVRWSFNSAEQGYVDDIREVLGRYGVTIRQHHQHPNKCVVIARCSNGQLAHLLRTCGTNAHDKALPEELIGLPEAHARELVRGYWRGDGTVTPDGGSMNSDWARITSVSLPMLMGFYRILPRLGVAPQVIKGGDSRFPKYEIRFPMCDAPWLAPNARPVRRHSVKIDDDRLLVKIKAITVDQYDGPVYDIQTPAHDFIANNFTVHNCDDLSGWLQTRDDGTDWRVINIPARADHDPAKGETDVLGREPGEYMISARGRTPEQWEQRKREVGSRTWEALFQGRPTPAAGNIFHRDWFTTNAYEQAQWIENENGTRTGLSFDEIITSWDLTFKSTEGTDYVCGQVWGRRDVHFWLLDQVHDRMDFVTTCQKVRALAAKWPQSTLKLVEDKANGPAVINMLRKTVTGLVPVEPDGSKEARAAAVSPLVEAGNVHVPSPELAPWVDDLIEEAVGFPRAAHDDRVDAMSQALNRMLLNPLIVDDDVIEDDEAEQHISPY